MATDLFAEAVAAWEAHGRNSTEAAKALGIPRKTFADRLSNGRAGRKYERDKPIVIREQSDAKLSQRIEQLTAALEHARKPRTKHHPGPGTKKQKGDYKRVVIPDTHGAHVDHAALKAVLADIRELKPSEIVLLGDHVDCGGFLAQHFTLGYVADADYSFEHDVSAANAFLDAVQQAAPAARVHYIEGNHERRIERWIVTQTLRHPSDAKYLHGLFSVESCLSLKQRGIEHYQQGKCYGGLPFRGTIKLGKCYFTHGHRTGASAARAMLADYGSNVVFGHTHTAAHASDRSVQVGTMGAWNPGCLCELQPLYAHTGVTDWSHGYGLQLVRSSGEFLHVTIPVIDGRSFLVPLLR